MGAGFVQQQYPGAAQDGAGQAHELLMPVAQDVASVLQLEVQFVRELLNH